MERRGLPGTGRFVDRQSRRHAVTGNLAPDAYLATIAIEAGCELATADRDYARFTGLRWRHPPAP